MTKQYAFHNRALPYVLVLPQMIIVIIFFFWPAFMALYQSLFIQDAFGISLIFVGLENYIKLFQNPQYLDSLVLSFKFAILVAFSALTISLFLAVQANKHIWGKTFYTTMLVWPYAVSTLVAGILWMFLFNPTVGIISYQLKRMGIDWNYLVKSGQALFLVTLASSWKQISYNFVFFLAGLQNVPVSLVEAAAIDGGGPLNRFWRVVFPLLSPTTFYLLVMNLVYAFFETFPIIHQVTSGGPNQATNILVYKVYKDGVINLDLGSSAAQSVVLMLIVIILSALQFRFVERKVEY
ncbi:sn-glycerol-3-phosphate ABC transporter permease UgpA [Gracilinema caldarium]|uniref:sn-glycerol-3-phosphate ABC transporter permease UgpA n=1 Tax=Gracilinema caldarium TaxID=215591 RepID=UPI0016B6925C|nr:sn-glycerol-3-phosphate ABC transporter permease UgpA [Gracilinema caldarium]NLJ08774.1 sn-glycerol-3-phosphate ABC transporter permease UgpA [Treponema sp.]